ncbi:Alpha/Beta hydrolase protein [Mycena latifolia]|nr:Alpha/Beta hydrolase protein [Mycena latifolia]
MGLTSLKLLQGTLVFLVSVRTAYSTNTPVVDLGYAQYQGVFDADLNITSFLGIRYAAPPTGNLRWRAPAPPAKVDGVQLAYSQPPKCYQGTLGASLTNPLAARDLVQTEDCLFLSVYSPALNSTKPLPTIVWIHGGGYAFGAASDYNGAELVQESNREIVVVVIQYRLGLFGFLAGQQVKDGGALNAGLLDQDFALRWVNKHAETAFSGDPEKVTIWGQSAGTGLLSLVRIPGLKCSLPVSAGSVLQHIVANNGRTRPQLFRAGITSSTFLPSQYGYNDRVPQTLFNDVATQAGCSTGDALKCLRAVDSASLQDINLSEILAGFQGTFTFVPVVDGSFITRRPTDFLAQGHLNGDILLSVTNSNEGPLFVNQSVEYNVAQYALNLFPLFGARESAAVASVYQSLGSPLEQVNAIMGESIFVCPTYRLLDAFPGESYKGKFAVPPALHNADVFQYFPSFTGFPGSNLRFNNTVFNIAFAQGFLSFAANLDPNDKLVPSITPVWRKWSGSHTEMVFNRTESNVPWIAAAPTSQALSERCNFWHSLRNLTAQ